MKIIFFLLFFNFFIYSVEEENCTICLETLNTENGKPLALPCNHTFHTKCIKELFSLPDTRIDIQHVNVAAPEDRPDYENIATIVNNRNRECPLCRMYIGNKEVFLTYKDFVKAEKDYKIIDTLNAAKSLSELNFCEEAVENAISHASDLSITMTLNQSERDSSLQKIKNDLEIFQGKIIKRLLKLIKFTYDSVKNQEEEIHIKFYFLKYVYLELFDTVFIEDHEFLSSLIELFDTTIKSIVDIDLLNKEKEYFEDFNDEIYEFLDKQQNIIKSRSRKTKDSKYFSLQN